jgi:hypothetical protein
MKNILPKIKNYKFISLVVFSIVIASAFGSCVPTSNNDVTVKLYLPESNNASSSDINALANCDLTSSFVGAYNINTGATAISDVSAIADPALYAGIASGSSVLTFNGTPELKVKTGKGWNFYYFGTFGLTGCSTGQSVISFGEVRGVDISAETSLGLEVTTPSSAVSQDNSLVTPGFTKVKFRWTGSGSTPCASSGAVHLSFPSLGKKGTASSGIPYSVTGQTTGLAELEFGPIPKNLIYEAKVNQTSPDTREMKFLFSTIAETNVTILDINVPASAAGFCLGGASAASLAINEGPSYNFGNVTALGSSDKTFTVTNSGGLTASSMSGAGLATPFTFKGGSYPGTGGTCGASLAGSATCTVVVNYSPTAVGLLSDTIELSYNDGSTTQSATRAVNGTGITASTLAISDGASFNFGNAAVNTITDKTFTITHAGASSATSIAGSGLAAPFTFKGGSFPGTGGTCTTTLTSGSCTMVVTFNSSSAGAASDTIIVSYNNGAASTSATRDVTGTAVNVASLAISDGSTYNFGSVALAASADHTFTVNNSGVVSATSMVGSGLAAPFTFKGGSYPGTAGTCSGTLAGSSSCTIVVNYAPGSAGPFSDTLDLTYNNGLTTGLVTSRAMTGSTPSAPTAPSSLVGFPDVMSAPNIMLTWADNSNNETGFEVERSTTGGGVGFSNITTTTAGATAYTDNTANAATTYYYRVRAINGSGNSSYSAEVMVVN